MASCEDAQRSHNIYILIQQLAFSPLREISILIAQMQPTVIRVWRSINRAFRGFLCFLGVKNFFLFNFAVKRLPCGESGSTPLFATVGLSPVRVSLEKILRVGGREVGVYGAMRVLGPACVCGVHDGSEDGE